MVPGVAQDDFILSMGDKPGRRGLEHLDGNGRFLCEGKPVKYLGGGWSANSEKGPNCVGQSVYRWVWRVFRTEQSFPLDAGSGEQVQFALANIGVAHSHIRDIRSLSSCYQRWISCNCNSVHLDCSEIQSRSTPSDWRDIGGTFWCYILRPVHARTRR